jgi:ADP-heptose:LPS heptosyltransferase
MQVLVHLASGVGNIVLATPLIVALNEMEFEVDVRLDADYPPAIELLQNWCAIRDIRNGSAPRDLGRYGHVIPAVPPFYWWKFAPIYRGLKNASERPPDSVFYENEQAFYLQFARALGYSADRHPAYRLPIPPGESLDVSATTLVIAPGCKTGEMTAKRWPHFPELAERFDDVAIVGTRDDLPGRRFPAHCRSYVDKLSLRETTELLASAGFVAGNDSGLSHVAAAVGTPTLMIFGPTSERVLGPLPPNVHVIRSGLACEPCWTSARLRACDARVDCLVHLTVDRVEAEVRKLLISSVRPEAACAARTKSCLSE